MHSIWTKDDELTLGSLFDVAYPQSLSSHVADLRGLQIGEPEVTQITDNILEHPALDLKSVLKVFRLSGSICKDDITPIQKIMEECQNDMMSLEAKIKDTISTISQLSRELTLASARMVQKVSQIRLCEFLISSPHLPTYLPQDVLEEIFLACLATNRTPVPNPNQAPLQLAAICHRWRTIALSMPVLWNNLYVRNPNHLNLARTWIHRCDRPSLTISAKDPEITPSDIQELLDLLDTLSLSPRIIDVRFLAGHLGDVLIKYVLDHDQPALEELVVRERQGTLPSLPRAPGIRRIYSHVIPHTLCHSPPPSSLTVLWLIPELHFNALPIFLANCPNLESTHLKLSQRGLRMDPEPPLPHDVTHSRLRYLGISEISEGEGPPDDLLNAFTLPSLQIVEYSQGKTSAAWFGLGHILRSVHRFTLQSNKGNLSLEYLSHLLQRAPSLLELAISTDVNFMPDLITALTSMPRLPALQTIYLDISYSGLTRWLSFEPQLHGFGYAWSYQDGKRSPFQLVVQYWFRQTENQYETEDEARERREVKQMLERSCPRFHIQIAARRTMDYWFGFTPVLFGMTPLPSNAIMAHAVLEDDGSWRSKLGSVYRIM